MIVYVDTSALVKKYLREAGTDQVLEFLDRFEVTGTSTLTQVEIASAMAKAVRQGWVAEADMLLAWQDFLSHWPAYTRLPLATGVIDRAVGLTWKHGLRAYDAIHLTCALTWQDALGEEVIFACFDKRLQQAVRAEGLSAWPDLVG